MAVNDRDVVLRRDLRHPRPDGRMKPGRPVERHDGHAAVHHLARPRAAVVEAAHLRVNAAEARLRRGKTLLENKLSNADEMAALEDDLNAAKKEVNAKEHQLREVQANQPPPAVSPQPG